MNKCGAYEAGVIGQRYNFDLSSFDFVIDVVGTVVGLLNISFSKSKLLIPLVAVRPNCSQPGRYVDIHWTAGSSLAHSQKKWKFTLMKLAEIETVYRCLFDEK